MRRGFFFLFAVLLVMTSGISEIEAFESFQEPSYRSYFYNYPHTVPPDYVFRTERVFASPSRGLGIFNPVSETIKYHSRPKGAEAGAPDKGALLREKVKMIAAQLLENSRDDVTDGFVVMVNTFVNLNNLYKTSSLGRYMSEQLISELQSAGVEVVEMRKTPSVMISEGLGEYSLSRDMDQLDFVHSAHAVVVGTYTFADGRIFINARMLQNHDGLVLSTASLVFDLDSASWAMLSDENVPSPTGPGSLVKVRFLDK